MDDTPEHIQRIRSAEQLMITRFANGGFSISDSASYTRGGDQIAAYSNGHHLVEDLRLALAQEPVSSDGLTAEASMLLAETAAKQSRITRNLGGNYAPTAPASRADRPAPPPPTDD